MRIAVTGSIASDHLMTFRGRFADSLVVEQPTRSRCRFLADSLDIRRGEWPQHLLRDGKPGPAADPRRRAGEDLPTTAVG